MNKYLLIVGLLSASLPSGCAPPPSAPSTAEGEAPTVEAQQALAGVGKEGQSLRDHSDVQKIISGPISAYLHVKQYAELEIKIPHALSLFQASNGRLPKSHDEFMREIVEANQIRLPELPAGAVYRFNTEEGKLWVYAENEAPQ